MTETVNLVLAGGAGVRLDGLGLQALEFEMLEVGLVQAVEVL